MRGDKLVIRKYHIRAAEKLAKVLTPEILLSPSKYVITIAGESGSGKTEIAAVLARLLGRKRIKSVILQQDDYFRLPPKTNYRKRRRDISLVGASEVKLSALNKNIREFKDPKISKFQKPLVDFDKDTIKKEIVRKNVAKVMIVEGTYTSLLENVDKKVFLSRTYKETLRSRQARKREKLDKFDKKILVIEHGIISKHRKLADIVVGKNYNLGRISERKIRNICMLSIHGYVETKPIFGKTDTGGQVTYVLELAKALAKQNIKVDIYTRKFQHRKKIEKISKNVRIIRIPCGGDKFIAKERLFPCLNSFVNNMNRFMKKYDLRYDIYHSHYWDAGFVAMKLTEKLNHSFFFHTFHSLGAWKKEQMGGDPKKMEKLFNFKNRIKWEKAIFRKTKGLIMTSTDMVRRARKFYKYTSNNYTVIPAGVNVDFFRPLKRKEKEKRIDVPQNYIFWVGRFAANKGLDYLLNAFAATVPKVKDIFLVIGGGSKAPKPEEKKIRNELRKIIDKQQIKSRVFFTGHIKNGLMPSYYRRAKFFVLSSRFEPFGMTAAEAMSCGTAAIISKRAGIRKYLTNKKHCLMVNPANKKDLSWAFTILNRNQSFRNKIRKNGTALVRKEFSWENIAGKSLGFYYKNLQ
ncbi:MAG: glycosyltransferase [Candidatus Omnitrophota bacterium]|jgi:mannosylfructose-phosphate synthase